jgi:hypothetical protein
MKTPNSRRASDVAWRVANRELIAAKSVTYRKANRERIAVRGAAYHAAHREQRKAYDARYRAANREHIKTRQAAYSAGRAEQEKAKRAAYRASHPEEARESARDRQRKFEYGMTRDAFTELLGAQGGCCAICRAKHDRRLHVDHNHETGRVRGLLCGHCNSGLGFFRDEAALLSAAIEYLGRVRP